MVFAILIDSNDNVATVTDPVSCGEEVHCRCGELCLTVTALAAVPRYHKIAVGFIPCKGPVRKYGEVIGYARTDILVGGYVHTHNTADSLEEVEVP